MYSGKPPSLFWSYACTLTRPLPAVFLSRHFGGGESRPVPDSALARGGRTPTPDICSELQPPDQRQAGYMWVEYISDPHILGYTRMWLHILESWIKPGPHELRVFCFIRQILVGSAGVSALMAFGPWDRESWCFWSRVCQRKKLSRETSSHSISPFTKMPKKVESSVLYTPCVSFFLRRIFRH